MSTTQPYPVYPSMAACAGALGISVKSLKGAKKAGCPAFHPSGRVDSLQLLTWHLRTGSDAPSDESFEDAARREKIARANLLEIEQRKMEGELIHLDEAIERVARIVQPVASMVKDMPARLCQRCNPGDPQLARQVLEDYARDICSAVQEVKP